MPRSIVDIEQEAQSIGKRAANGTLKDHACIEVLAALVEDLSAQCRRLEDRCKKLEKIPRRSA